MKYWEMKKQQNNKATVYITGDIVSQEWVDDDTSASGFKQDLDKLGSVDNIDLHINSGGGSVFDGIAIFNMLKSNPAKITVYVDALAASIASVIAMAGDEIIMPSNSMLMIHNPWTQAIGNAKELRKMADDLDQIGKSSRQSYLSKTGDKLSEEDLMQLLDDETWLTAQEAVDYGFADEIVESNQMAASINKETLQHYKHAPKSLISEQENPDVDKPKDNTKKTDNANESEERQKNIKESRESEMNLRAFLNTKIYKNIGGHE